MTSYRVIIHLDLDSFYAQVEQLRLGLRDHDAPLAVLQWDHLIAVNYPARARGIKKSESAAEALKKCPELRTVHVATIAPGDTAPQYHASVTPQHKVSLDVYRAASADIMDIFKETPGVFERGGLDEAFLDVTEHCKRTARDVDATMGLDWTGLGHVIGVLGDDGDDVTDMEIGEMDIGLHQGAVLAKQLRKEVYERLGYRCSAGIAHTKALAKIGSGLHKPNDQTVIRQAAAPNVLRDLPLGKLRSLGGKAGREIAQKLGVERAGELWRYTAGELRERLGLEMGDHVFALCRGEDKMEVIARGLPKSILASKTFSPVRDMDGIKPWLEMFATELVDRMARDSSAYNRYPRSLLVTYRKIRPGKSETHSRTLPMTHAMRRDPQALVSAAVRVLSAEDVYPCTNLGMAATNFTEPPRDGKGTITEFLNNAKCFTKNELQAETVERGLAETPSTAPPQPPDADEFLVLCDECGKRIEIDAYSEHADYHLAKALQEEVKQETGRSVKRLTASASSGKSKKRKGTGARLTNSKTLDGYWH